MSTLAFPSNISVHGAAVVQLVYAMAPAKRYFGFVGVSEAFFSALARTPPASREITASSLDLSDELDLMPVVLSEDLS
jgi:hypothetical protein